MKKTIIIVLGSLMLGACSCKKEETKPVEPAPVASIDSTLFEVEITSNFSHTQSSFDNLTTNQTMVFQTAPEKFSFYARPDMKYLIRSYSTKNSSDSTLFMTDNKHIWNRMTMRNVKDNKIVYDRKDSIGSPGWCIVSNSIRINY